MAAFGAKVKATREAKGVSQEELALECGFATSHISRVENGKTNPSLSHIVKIANVLGVRPKDLLDF